MNVLRSLCSASLLLVWVSANARIPVKVETFPLNDVRLTQKSVQACGGFGRPLFTRVGSRPSLAPYLKGAGLEPKADNYTNWENTGLDGHIGDITFRRFPICMPPPETKKSNRGWTTCCPN